ncbi:nuclear transport factor 2 family protein [Allomuricauda sp. d1]|uniref:nuclear transport factor 2 family protein n=1 Tax=Allomuricauda sp. d1 TaxID=3136725 RepID=UPI0031E26FFA
MKKLVLPSLMVLALLAFVCCKQTTADSDSSDRDEIMETEMESSSDYADFDKKVATIRAFFQAHSDENLDAQAAMLADSLKFSPPYYNGNEWMGKDEFLAIVKGYHENFENIQYHEGVVTADQGTVGGFYSGSVYPKETAETKADVIRTYGTWTATHTESGQEIGVKFFNLSTFNEEGKIATFSDYFDLSGLAPKETEN